MTRFMQTHRKAAAAWMVHPAGLATPDAFFPQKIRAAIRMITHVDQMKAQTDIWVDRLSRTGTITAFHKAGKIRIVNQFVKKLSTAAESNQVYAARDAHLLNVVGRTIAGVPVISRKIKGVIAMSTKRGKAPQKNL